MTLFHLTHVFGRVRREDRGQDLIEYALLAAFISVVSFITLSQIGVSVAEVFDLVAEAVGAGARSNCSPTGIGASGGACVGQ